MAINRPLNWISTGQSYERFGLQEAGGYYTFMRALIHAIDNNAAAVATTLGISVSAGDRAQMHMLAVDGSAVLAVNAGSAGYWIENNGDAGPLLDAATTATDGYATKPHWINYSHFEQDAGQITTEAASHDVIDAVTGTLWPELRTAVGTVNGETATIFADLIGPRFVEDEFAEYWMRDRLIEVLDDATTVNVLRACEKYSLPLGLNTHPTAWGYQQFGALKGRKTAQWLIDKTQLRGPRIDVDNVAVVGDWVEVPILTPSGKTLVKPAAPQFFGLFDASENRLPIVATAWDGAKIKLKPSSPAALASLRYPARPTGAWKTSDIIRLSDPSVTDAYFTGERGLPLESIKTLVL